MNENFEYKIATREDIDAIVQFFLQKTIMKHQGL